MKSLKLAVVAMSLIGIFGVGNVMAGPKSTQVDVSATVLGTCSFDAATYAMSFGNINTTDTVIKDATANVQFLCTKNTAYSFDNYGNTTRNMSATLADTTTENLEYTIDAYDASGNATGMLTTVPITGHIAVAKYQAASAATYTDTLTLTITP